MKKKKGFTLPEVLITIGIIGVVAAMSISTLINKAKARRMHSQFMKAYSTLQQVMLRIEEEGDSADPSLYYSTPGALKNVFIKYLNGATDCGVRSGNYQTESGQPCYNSGRWNSYSNRPRYSNMTGTNVADGAFFESGQILMQDGSLWLFYSADMHHPTTITIDINGYKTPPDRLGYDLFTFEYVDGKFLPEGALNTKYRDKDTFCSVSSSDVKNGVACTVRAKDEKDYFDWAISNIKL